MNIAIFDNLIKRYTAKADDHGFQSIMGAKKYRDYHAYQESLYDSLIIKIIQKYLKESAYGN